MDIDFNEVQDFKETESYKLLKKQIAMQHGYSISDDDPLLMFVTLNEFMLKQYQEQLDDSLSQLDNIVFNTKSDITNHIKEQEMSLFKRIQEINNKNVENINSHIKDYFKQEAEAYQILKNNYDVNLKFSKYGVVINLIFILIVSIITIVR